MSHPFNLLSQLGKKFSGVIHVGANSGQEVPAYKKFLLKRAVLIEPLPDAFKQLRQVIGDQDGFLAVRALCSYLPSIKHDFYIASNNGQSSSILKPKRHKIEHPDVEFKSTMQIESTTLDLIMTTVAARTNMDPAQFDTLVMDVQGAELMVLKGGLKTLDHIDFVFTEVSHGGLYENDVVLEDLQQFLNLFDFRLVWLAMNNHGWGDALFIKQMSRKSQ